MSIKEFQKEFLLFTTKINPKITVAKASALWYLWYVEYRSVKGV